MNIVININSKFYFPAKVMVKSLAENCNEKLDVYCLHKELTKKQIDEFSTFIEKECHGSLHPIFMGDRFVNMPTSKVWTTEIYYRLCAVHILPDNIDRFLYLDADMVCLGDISEIYHQDFDDKLIVAAPDQLNNLALGQFSDIEEAKSRLGFTIEEAKSRLGLSNEHIYFNAGMILFNAKEIREVLSSEDIYKYCEEYKDRVIAFDQDILNVMYSGKVKYADCNVFNYQIQHNYKFDMLDSTNKNIVLIHFLGPIKPWNFRWINASKRYFWKYAKACGYYGKYLLFRICNPIINFLMNIKYRILKVEIKG